MLIYFYIYYICVYVLAQVYLCRIFVIHFSFSASLLLSLIIKRYFLEYLLFLLFWDDTVNEESEKFSNGECSASGCCLAFAYFFPSFSLALLIKVLLIKKSVQSARKYCSVKPLII